MDTMDMTKYPMVETLIEDVRAAGLATGCSDITSDQVIAGIHRGFDAQGPYHFAKNQNLLVNGSGEEFACQFMAFFNDYTGQQVY